MTEEKAEPGIEVEVVIDGMPLGMAPFVRKVISATIVAMITALKGAENAQAIEIKVRRKS